MFEIRKKILIILIMTFFVVAVDGYFIWSINFNNSESDKIITNINVEINEEAERGGVQAAIQGTKADRQLLDSYFIDEEGEVSFVDSLGAISNKAGVALKIESATFENYPNIATNTPVELVHIRLRTSGDWSAVIGFWTLLDSTPYRLTVDRVDLSKGESLKGVSIWDQVVDITAYKKK